MAITETLSVTTSTTSLTTSVGATDRELVKLYHVVASPASITLINSALYTITGYSDTSQKLSIVFDDWTDYVGDSILVVIYTDIDTGNVADAMLTNFGTAANISPTTLQNEMAHVYYIIGQITGGAAVADVSLADLSDAITRINDLADDIFTTTTNAGSPALWDGTNTLSIGGDTNVQAILTTHESRLDTAETDIAALEATDATHTAQLAGTTSSGLKKSIQALSSSIGSAVGLPSPVPSSTTANEADGTAPMYVLAADTMGVVQWIDLRSQILPVTRTNVVHVTGLASASPVQLSSGAYTTISATLTLPAIIDDTEVWSVVGFAECDNSTAATQGTIFIACSGAAAAATIDADSVVELDTGTLRIGGAAVCSYKVTCAQGETVTFFMRGSRTSGSGTIDIYRATLFAFRLS